MRLAPKCLARTRVLSVVLETKTFGRNSLQSKKVFSGEWQAETIWRHAGEWQERNRLKFKIETTWRESNKVAHWRSFAPGCRASEAKGWIIQLCSRNVAMLSKCWKTSVSQVIRSSLGDSLFKREMLLSIFRESSNEKCYRKIYTLLGVMRIFSALCSVKRK